MQERAVLTADENDAMVTLKLLHFVDTPNHKLSDIVHALQTLRPRDAWARSTHNNATPTPASCE